MKDWMWIAIAVVAIVVVLLVIAAGARSARRRHRSSTLRSRFGPEYDRAVGRSGREDGERELEDRIRAHDERSLRDVSPQERERAIESWRAVQMSFVDAPVTAVRDADHLVFEVLRERGYPVDSLDDRAGALSVERPELASKYRDAHRALVSGEERGDGDVGRLRDAFLSYRELLANLVGVADLRGRVTSAERR